MRDALRHALDAYDARRTALLDEIASVPDVLHAVRSDPGRWSILEITEHLALAEREVLRGLPDPARLVPQSRSLASGLRRRMLKGILTSRIRVGTPSAGMSPTGGRSLHEIRALWNENMVWLAAHIEEASDERLAEAVFAHPVSGPLTTAEVLWLADLHLQRHWDQIRALRDSSG
ncbi:MAG: DinB family protein [Bacteroidota bacterium]